LNNVSHFQMARAALSGGQNRDSSAAFEASRRPLHGLAARVAL
jgi:hypothetical protein